MNTHEVNSSPDDVEIRRRRDEAKRHARAIAVHTLATSDRVQPKSGTLDSFILDADRLAKFLVDGVLPKVEADGSS